VSEDGEILGVNKRSYPALAKDGGHCTCLSCGVGYVDVKVVLVAGAIGDYAAYAGSGPVEWIKKYGDKISFVEACVHFPGSLEEERYRA